MTDDAAPFSGRLPTQPHHRLLVLGANGPTGRQIVQQALARGHRVQALTRHPEAFPIRHERLKVVAGDATDPTVIDSEVAATDAVICTIGVAFTWKPVQVYSVTARLLIEAMSRHECRRLIVVTSAGVHPSDQQRGLTQTLSHTLMRRSLGRTVYDDMVRMEQLVSASGLNWTIVRPPGLTNEPGRGYAAAPNEIEGSFCSREDLAHMLLDQLNDTRFHQSVAAITTPGLTVSATHMVRREVLKR